LTFQDNPKYSGLVSRFFQCYQQDFNLKEGHYLLDPLPWESILEDSKLCGVLGGWAILIHEKLQSDPFRLVRVRPINLVRLLHLENKRNGGRFLRTEGGKAAEYLENLFMGNFLDLFIQQECDHSALSCECSMLRGQLYFMLVIHFRLFIELIEPCNQILSKM
jgi:hypothetical protein